MKININFSHIFTFFPFIHDVKIYTAKKFHADIIAGLTVAIVGTPQAIAYAIIAGVDPRYGLYACIVPVIVAALMGSSRFLIAGPTNTVSMIIFSTMSTLTISGIAVSQFPDDQKIGLVFLIAIIAGTIQVLLGIAKAGSLLNFISHSVIVGFTAGAGILIGFNQIKNFLGLHFQSSPHFIESITETIHHAHATDWRALLLGIFTILFVIISKKISPKIPGSLLALVFSSVIVAITGWSLTGLSTVGMIPQTLPPLSLPHFDMEILRAIFMPSLAIAILGVVEAYSIAKSFCAKSGDKINGNQEFIGQGLGNIAAGFFSGIPGTGSFTRSAVNFSSHAATRFAAVFSALMVLVILLLFARGAQYIPIASLAGILMVIAYSMVDKHAMKMAYNATAADRIVLIATIIATLFLHLDQAVYVGVALSIILFIRKISHPQVFQVTPHGKERRLLRPVDEKKLCPQISIFQVEGSLFFGAVSELEENISSHIKNGGKIFIIRMAYVHLIDATGIHALDSLLKEAKEKDIQMIFVNLKPAVLRVFQRTHMIDKVGRDNIFEHTKDALISAISRIRKTGACKNCKIKCFEECPRR